MEGSDRAKDAHLAFLEQHHASLSDAARLGFRTHGRGAVFLFEDAILEAERDEASAVTIEYIADGSDALARRGGWPTERHAELIRGYDPAFTSIVVVGRRHGDAELFTYQLVSGVAGLDAPARVGFEDLFG